MFAKVSSELEDESVVGCVAVPSIPCDVVGVDAPLAETVVVEALSVWVDEIAEGTELTAVASFAVCAESAAFAAINWCDVCVCC